MASSCLTFVLIILRLGAALCAVLNGQAPGSAKMETTDNLDKGILETFAPLFFAGPTIQHEKRELLVVTRRNVLVTYRCPVADRQVKIFRWAAQFDHEDGNLTLLKGENVDSFGHVNVVTNNFTSEFTTQRAEIHGRFCCGYLFKATVIGTVWRDYIGMGITAQGVNPREGMLVKEYCVPIPEGACPVQVPANPPPGGFRDCRVISAVLGHN